MTVEADDLLTTKQVQSFFGGAKPICHSTLTRWVRIGKLAPPIRMSPTLIRWRRSDCERALEAMRAEMEEKNYDARR